MKKMFFLITFILSFSLNKNSNANSLETLRNACVASKIADYATTIGGAALAAPSIYYISKYLNKKVFSNEKNQGLLTKIANKSLYIVGNITLTATGVGLIAYGLNKIDISKNLLKMQGFSSMANNTCDYIVWPKFKQYFAKACKGLFSY